MRLMHGHTVVSGQYALRERMSRLYTTRCHVVSRRTHVNKRYSIHYRYAAREGKRTPLYHLHL